MHHTRCLWHRANPAPFLHKSARVIRACQTRSGPGIFKKRKGSLDWFSVVKYLLQSSPFSLVDHLSCWVSTVLQVIQAVIIMYKMPLWNWNTAAKKGFSNRHLGENIWASLWVTSKGCARNVVLCSNNRSVVLQSYQIPRASGQSLAIPDAMRRGDTGLSKRKCSFGRPS